VHKEFDSDYKEKRLATMNSLGWDVGEVSRITPCLKYHGKKARERSNDVRQLAITRDLKQEAKKRLEVHGAVREVKEMTSLVKKLRTYIEAKQPPPAPLMRQLLGGGGSRANKLKPIEQDSIGNASAKAGVATGVHSPTTTRVPGIVRKDYTAQKWSQEERKRLNELYVDIPRPTSNHLTLWRLYYDKVCSRFRAFYPLRSNQEVEEKFESMIKRRQFKEPGEENHWKEVSKGGANRNTNADEATLASTMLLSPSLVRPDSLIGQRSAQNSLAQSSPIKAAR